MRINGLSLIISMATRELNDPLINHYEKAIILGAFREDVWYIPGVKSVIEHLSLSHFYGSGLPGGFFPFLWPGARAKSNRFHARAVNHFRAGNKAAAFVQLGRAAHLLADMACPVHVHRVVHETDPYEWFIEGNRARLLALPAVRSQTEPKRASDLIEAMSRFTESFESDKTNSPHGRLLRRLGARSILTRETVAAQAEKIIPVAAGHTAALFQLFLRRAGKRA
ncbi:MAG: hypothetical protein HY074_12795 [Deltaproteobacteria bacterium]|nr:hypothetical protein [Deltaproteobacteria bacterium]